MIDVVLFDLDGTITASAPGITNCVKYALDFYGYRDYEEKDLNCFIGPPLRDMFMEYAGFSYDLAVEATAKYRERYSEVGLFEAEVYEGIEETLAALKDMGFVLGTASSKPQIFLEKILDHFSLTQYFDHIVGAEMTGKRHEKKDVLLEALRQSGCQNEPGRAVLIGDRLYDVEGAKICNVSCVGAAYGYGGREELESYGADWVIDRPIELLDLAKSWKSATR